MLIMFHGAYALPSPPPVVGCSCFPIATHLGMLFSISNQRSRCISRPPMHRGVDRERRSGSREVIYDCAFLDSHIAPLSIKENQQGGKEQSHVRNLSMGGGKSR